MLPLAFKVYFSEMSHESLNIFFRQEVYINIAEIQLHPASATTNFPSGITGAHS
jgi:hypothetical protein